LIGGIRWYVVRSELERASFAGDVTQRGAHLTVVESQRWPRLPPVLREIWRRRSLTVDIPTEAALENVMPLIEGRRDVELIHLHRSISRASEHAVRLDFPWASVDTYREMTRAQLPSDGSTLSRASL